MTNRQLLLNSGLILIIATVLPISEGYYDHELRNDEEAYEIRSRVLVPYNPIKLFDLHHYDIELTILNFENTAVNYFNFSGKCKLYVNFTGTSALHLYIGNTIKILNSNVVKQDQPERNISYHFSKTSYASFTRLRFYVYSADMETYILTLEFNGIAYDNEIGLFRTSYIQKENKRWLLAMNFGLLGAHRVFPCIDEPSYKATFNISIICNEKYQVISNMALDYEQLGTLNSTHILQKDTFKTTPNIRPTLIGFVMYDFLYKDIIRQGQTHIIHFRDPKLHINFAKKVIEDIATFFNNNWQKLEEIMDEKSINYVLIPGFPFNSKDNWKLIYFREESVIYNEHLDSFARKIEVARLISQTMAHQIFGNLVSSNLGTDEWLNDGIAVFFGIDAINEIYSNTRMWDLFVVQDLHESLRLDPYIRTKLFNVLHLTNTIDLEVHFNLYRYFKAPALLRMLRYTLPEKIFRDAIHLYLKKYQYGSASVDDFFIAVQDVLHEARIGFSRMAMHTWTLENYPIVNVTTKFNKNKHRLDANVSQINEENFLAPENSIPENGKRVKWWIPITWIIMDFHIFRNMDDINNYTKIEWISPYTPMYTILTYSSNGVIFINPNRLGYYRVNYDVQHWQRIAQFLNSPNYAHIPALTRAQLIDDAFYFMVTQKLESSVFWNLTNLFMQETDYIAWYPMIKALEYMSSIFPFSDDRVDVIKGHMVKILQALLNKIGYSAKSNEDNFTKCLMEEAVKWACVLGDSICKTYATEILQWHLQNREEHRLLPWWKEWTYCKGLMEADSMIWHNVLRLWQKEHDHTVLKHLLCSQDYYIVLQFLTLLSGNKIVNLQFNESAHSFLHLLSGHSNKYLLEDIFEQFLDIKPNAVTEIAALNVIINHIYSEEQLKQVETFVSDKLSDLKLIVHHKIQTRLAEIENRIKYLDIVSK